MIEREEDVWIEEEEKNNPLLLFCQWCGEDRRTMGGALMRITLKKPLLNGLSRSRLNSMAETFKTYMQIL